MERRYCRCFFSLLGTSQSVGLFYDTTFRLGDYYGSILSFVDVEFKNKPTIPLLFMIHERKTFETHDLFLEKSEKQTTGAFKGQKRLHCFGRRVGDYRSNEEKFTYD
jgi:hypothetical protein